MSRRLKNSLPLIAALAGASISFARSSVPFAFSMPSYSSDHCPKRHEAETPPVREARCLATMLKRVDPQNGIDPAEASWIAAMMAVKGNLHGKYRHLQNQLQENGELWIYPIPDNPMDGDIARLTVSKKTGLATLGEETPLSSGLKFTLAELRNSAHGAWRLMACGSAQKKGALSGWLSKSEAQKACEEIPWGPVHLSYPPEASPEGTPPDVAAKEERRKVAETLNRVEASDGIDQAESTWIAHVFYKYVNTMACGGYDWSPKETDQHWAYPTRMGRGAQPGPPFLIHKKTGAISFGDQKASLEELQAAATASVNASP